VKRSRLFSYGLCAAALSIAAAGCSSHSGGSSGTAPTAPAFKVALLTTGPTTDHGWNEAAYDGLQAIAAKLPAQVATAFEGFASQGYNLIIAHGDEYADAAAKVAPQFPAVDFVTTGGDRTAPNLAPIVFATEEGTYLQGMEAGYLTKTNKGGFVGGQALPPVTVAADAFENGAKSVNPKFTLAITG
jgi:basic membrane protein A